ncbi:hypothetical protein LguiA_025558 [Lonicera macranthoides]
MPLHKLPHRRFQAPRAVAMHLIQKGIQPSYTMWSFHGESFHKPPVHHPEDEVDEMADVLADLAGHGGYGEASNTSSGSFNDLPTDNMHYNPDLSPQGWVPRGPPRLCRVCHIAGSLYMDQEMRYKFWEACKTGTPKEFKGVMDEIYALDNGAHEYLMKKNPNT